MNWTFSKKLNDLFPGNAGTVLLEGNFFNPSRKDSIRLGAGMFLVHFPVVVLVGLAMTLVFSLIGIVLLAICLAAPFGWLYGICRNAFDRRFAAYGSDVAVEYETWKATVEEKEEEAAEQEMSDAVDRMGENLETIIDTEDDSVFVSAMNRISEALEGVADDIRNKGTK